MRLVRQTLAYFPCVCSSLVAVRPPAVLAQYQKFEGRQIVTIQFEPKDQPLDASELHDILPLKQGQPLRMADVRASIERLFATGRYADIQVDAEPYSDNQKGGVIVRFLTKNSWFIGNVTVSGNISSPPSARPVGKRHASRSGAALYRGQAEEAIANQTAAAGKQRPLPRRDQAGLRAGRQPTSR